MSLSGFVISHIVLPLHPRSADFAQARHGIVRPAIMRYYLKIMARIKETPTIEPLKVHSLKLTPTAEQALHRLTQDASDALGWTVSKSAMIRALLSYVEQQPRSWVTTTIHPHIEQEIVQGRVWGKKKQQE
jgi:hypothetical protein